MKTRRGRHPFDGLDAPPFALEPEVETGEHRATVDENGARSALAELATVLRPGQAEILAEDLEERLVWSERDLDALAVDVENDVRFRAIPGRKKARPLHFGRSLSPMFRERNAHVID
jgi:hypothetical protein